MSPSRLVLALLAMVVVGCQSAPAESGAPVSGPAELRQVTLALGYRPDVQFAPFYVAQREGYYADAGLEVTIEHHQAPDVQRLVADGQAEFGVADATDVMIARTSGFPIRYASTLYQSFPVALIGEVADVPDEPAGLAGKTIGTPGRFGSSWHALLALLDAGGLSEDDVTIREYPQFNQVDGLVNGDVELITGFRNNEPLRLEARGITVGLLTVDDIVPLPGPGVIVGDELLASDRDLVDAFVDATAAAQAARERVGWRLRIAGLVRRNGSAASAAPTGFSLRARLPALRGAAVGRSRLPQAEIFGGGERQDRQRLH